LYEYHQQHLNIHITLKSLVKKLGIVLGGGCVKGAAFVGLLKVLDEEKIRIDRFASTSMGAIVSALYAYGHSTDEILNIMLSHNPRTIFGVRDFFRSKHALSNGGKVLKYLKKYFGNTEFNDLSIPIKITGMDLNTGKRVIFEQGPIVPALRVSMSYPGIFTPVRYNGTLLVDGGVTDPVPVDLIKDEVDVTLTCRIPSFHNTKIGKGIWKTWSYARPSFMIMRDQLVKAKLKITPTDILIEPQVQYFNDWALTKKVITACYDSGEIEAKKYLPQIQQHLYN